MIITLIKMKKKKHTPKTQDQRACGICLWSDTKYGQVWIQIDLCLFINLLLFRCILDPGNLEAVERERGHISFLTTHSAFTSPVVPRLILRNSQSLCTPF